MNKTIACLKWGSKYDSNYVNILYNMCKRHTSIPFEFVCFTDNAYGLDSKITIKSLPNVNLSGWWLKPYVFCKTNGLRGNILFLDLDIVIYENIDKLWNYNSSDFLIIRDFTRHMNPGWQRYNSSVFRFIADDYYWIWDNFINDHKQIVNKNHGDQDYLYSILKNKAKFWPDHWIQSYKWEMRDKNDVALVNGRRNFTCVKDPRIVDEGCIAVFHGDPNPHVVTDPWVINHWK